METVQRHSAFISYSRSDAAFALDFARELKQAGYPVWLDQLDIPTGARWDDAVEKALSECEIFLIILTPASVASANVKDEIGYAIDNGKRILPILLKECTIPLRLRRFQYVNFTETEFREGIKRAEQLLHNFISESTTPDAPFVTLPETEHISKKVRPVVVSESTQSNTWSRTRVSNRKRIFTLAAAVVVLIVAAGVIKLLSLSNSPSNGGNQQITSGPTALPMVRTVAQFRAEFSNPLSNYDFDGGQNYDDFQNPDVDFFFKPDNAANPQSLVGVDPLNGAKIGGGYLDVLPWEIPQDQFMTTFYSVPQNRQIPCITSQGVYCSFTLVIAENGLTIGYTVYDR